MKARAAPAFPATLLPVRLTLTAQPIRSTRPSTPHQRRLPELLPELRLRQRNCKKREKTQSTKQFVVIGDRL